MKRLPGFRYDAKTKEARFEVCLPGSGGGRRRRKTILANSWDEAFAKWKAFRESVTDPTAPKMKGAAPTFRKYVETWFLPADAKPTKDEHYMIRRALLPFFGDDRLDRINVARMRDFVKALRDRKVDGKPKPYSASTIRALEALVRRVLLDAVDRDELAFFPLKQRRVAREKIPILRLELTPEERVRFLAAFDDEAGFRRLIAQEEQRSKVARIEERRQMGLPTTSLHGAGRAPEGDAVREHFERFRSLKGLFIAALETGLRRGDLMRLRWSSVNLKDGWIRVTMGKTKAEAVIPISSACRSVLKARKALPVVRELVFVNEDGGPYPEKTLERYSATAKALAGITRRCRFHDLRHTFASDLASAGVGLQQIAKALGHTSTDMTQRYAKPSEESLRMIARALDLRRNELPDELSKASGDETSPAKAAASDSAVVGYVGRDGGIRTRPPVSLRSPPRFALGAR